MRLGFVAKRTRCMHKRKIRTLTRMFFSTVLDEILAKGDPAGFETFRVRVANHGLVPAGAAQTTTSAGYGASAGYRPNTMAPGGGAKVYGGGGASRRKSRDENRDVSRTNGHAVAFRSSCFYEKLEPVLKPQDLPGRFPFSSPHS